MTIATITRPAKCKDCKFLQAFYKGKRKLHICFNDKSNRYGETTTLNTIVCKNWKL